MTPEEVLEVIKIYRKFFERIGIKKVDFSHDYFLAYKHRGLEHCHGMLGEMTEFVRQNRMEESLQQLGFIQGYLWGLGIYSLTDLKNHSRPDKDLP